MGFFSFTQELAMDLGTANTIITSGDEIVVDEPSVVALDQQQRMIAVGNKAKLMYEKTNNKIQVIRPLRDGVIADFYACEQMMRGLIKMVNTGKHLFTPSLRMVIGVPSGSTEVELRAVLDFVGDVQLLKGLLDGGGGELAGGPGGQNGHAGSVGDDPGRSRF